MIYCWDWRHEVPVPARDGCWTCALHANAETEARATVQGLAEVGDEVESLANTPPRARHPDEPKAKVEKPVREFFKELPDIRVEIGFRAAAEGVRTEMDVTIILGSDDERRLPRSNTVDQTARGPSYATSSTTPSTASIAR